MAEEQVEALPVLESGELVGIIYEKDCITKFILNGRSMNDIQVKEIMSPNIITVSPLRTVEECLDVMTEEHIQYIPVTVNTYLLGFLSLSDISRTIIEDQKDYLYRLDNYVLGIDFGK
jgi:CBS domain-containing protein